MTTLKCAVLLFVFLRFHVSWVGLGVVIGMAILLFRVDRTLLRFALGVTGARR